MLPAIKDIDNQIVNDGHFFSFPSQASDFTDAGRAVQGRDSLSPAVVIAFVDDLSGSAPLSIADCDDSQQFSLFISALVSIYVDVLHKRGMILNTKPCRSAIMVSLAGLKSLEAKHWLNDLQCHLAVSDSRFQPVHLYRVLDSKGSTYSRMVHWDNVHTLLSRDTFLLKPHASYLPGTIGCYRTAHSSLLCDSI